MAWSPQQEQAIKAVSDWLRNKRGPQTFRLFGFAGTGKTTIAKEIAANVSGRAIFGAFTGKAALVLKSKGCDNASTIHSMIYKVEEGTSGQPTFVLNRDSDVLGAKVVIIDECSMVDEALGKDLLSFGTRILVLGDPAQLPPVKGQGFFTSGRPDVLLTEIHRQAADNPIIRMSMEVREGRRLQVGSYGGSKVIRRAELKQSEVLAADQVLVGMNRTRRSFNGRLRELNGFSGELPTEGDRIICLRNNKDKGLLNGSIWEARDVKLKPVDDDLDVITATASPADEYTAGSADVFVTVPRQFFLGTEDTLDWRTRRDFDEFDFGYAITVHKSQGSQWDNVMLFDESGSFRDNRMNWLYTGITRAADRVTVVLP